MHCILAQQRNVEEIKILLADLRQMFALFRAHGSWKRKQDDSVAIKADAAPNDSEQRVIR